MFFWFINLNNNGMGLKVCYNHRVLNNTWRLLVLTHHWATLLFLNTNVFKITWNYTNMLGSVTTNNNSNILLRLLWFLLLNDQLIKIPDIPWHPTTAKKPSAKKSLCLFTNILHVKNKTAIRQVGTAKSKHKVIKVGTTPLVLKPNLKVNSGINNKINKSLYNWIINHLQVLQSTIFGDCLKVNIYGHSIIQIVSNVLLQMSAREIHNSLFSDPVYVGIKEARDLDNNTIISDSKLSSLLSPQL